MTTRKPSQSEDATTPTAAEIGSQEPVTPTVVSKPVLAKTDDGAGHKSPDVEREAAPAVDGPASMGMFIADPGLWPAKISLSEDARFPAVYLGKTVGEVKVAAGTAVDLIAIENDRVKVGFRDGVLLLPHAATNLREIAAAKLEAAESGPETRAPPPSPTRANRPAGKPRAEARLVAAAARIDDVIRASHVKRRQDPPALISDEKFLRRAYLTGVGRIPTAGEAREFLADPSPHKRANLVTSLVRSPGYASQMTNWMFDRLRIVDYNRNAQIRYPIYRQWVKEAVASNMAWDKMVTSLLTSEGDGWDPATAPVGYFTRDRGMPLDNMAITMRVFLGSRMECAQCHNDPFGDTKQKDFFRLAAFTSGLDTMKQNLFEPVFREMNALPQDSVGHQASWMFWRDIYGNSLAGGGTGRITLPHDYKYKDGWPGDIEGGRFPFGRAVSLSNRQDRNDGRRKLAGWMTEGTGGRFPAMIANGMWRKVMGRGFFEPGDEYLEPEETYEASVSRLLAELMVDLDFNLRDFQEVLMLSEVFQAESTPLHSEAPGGADDFLGRRLVRLSAEQIWDSMVTLIEGNPDNQPPRAVDDRIFLGGRPVLEGTMTMSQLSREVLAQRTEEELRDYFSAFVSKVEDAAAHPPENEASMAMMGGDPVGFVRGSLARASEMPSPAPPGHFLGVFGQSNREIVDGSTREPNLAQVLSLMNGFVQRELVGNPEARLNDELNAGADADAKIRSLFLSLFSREPSAEETTALLSEFQTSPATAPANIASAMIMSAEFLYLQ